MNMILLFLLFSKVYALTLIKPTIINKQPITYNSDLYEVKPHHTVLSYNLNIDHKIDIQNEINQKTNKRFMINDDNIYITLHDCIYEETLCMKFQVFVYVHDYKNQLNGQYILESKEYKIVNNKNIICSFYDNNLSFYSSFSYYQYNIDQYNYNNSLSFDFIYNNLDDKELYLKNIGIGTKQSYTPNYNYISEFKYKNRFWKKSDKIFYYKQSFYYKKLV